MVPNKENVFQYPQFTAENLTKFQIEQEELQPEHYAVLNGFLQEIIKNLGWLRQLSDIIKEIILMTATPEEAILDKEVVFFETEVYRKFFFAHNTPEEDVRYVSQICEEAKKILSESRRQIEMRADELFLLDLREDWQKRADVVQLFMQQIQQLQTEAPATAPKIIKAYMRFILRAAREEKIFYSARMAAKPAIKLSYLELFGCALVCILALGLLPLYFYLVF